VKGKLSTSSSDINLVREIWHTLHTEVSRVIIGMERVLEEIFICLIGEGHILLEGPPGIAKTTLAKTVANVLDLSFSRIQFTPDLLPADIIGTKVYDPSRTDFVTKKGPIFANIVLADEINRAGPKTQSALLEAMQEKQVTIEGETFRLPKPFLVIATENPIEVEGTYALPSAQLDRFLIKSNISYPSREEYERIITTYSGYSETAVARKIKRDDILIIQRLINKVTMSNDILNYIVNIIEEISIDKRIKWGVSPRGGIFLAKAAKAYALMNGRDYVVPEDVKRVMYPVINHRIILTPEAVFQGVTVKDILDDIITRVKVPI
jgi:MoxR-like ATPase